MPTLRMRRRDPCHHLGQLSIVARPQQQIPVIRDTKVFVHIVTNVHSLVLKRRFVLYPLLLDQELPRSDPGKRSLLCFFARTAKDLSGEKPSA
jgi:hypothetical protein